MSRETRLTITCLTIGKTKGQRQRKRRAPMSEDNGEPNNAERAERITVLLAKYDDLLGEVPEEPTMQQLACLMADIRHFCDARGFDYTHANSLSYEHYVQEQPTHG